MATARWNTGSSVSFRYGGVLPCEDGFVELLTLEQRQWDGLVELLGRPEWALDPALADSLERSRRGPELNRHIRAWAATRKVEDIVREGQKLSVPLAKYNTPAEVLRDPHEKVRGLFQPVEVPGAGVLDMLVSPVQFDGKASTLAKNSSPTGGGGASVASAGGAPLRQPFRLPPPQRGRISVAQSRSQASASPISPCTTPGRSAPTCSASSARK